jgi:iron(III) transport system substrate-binding protein
MKFRTLALAVVLTVAWSAAGFAQAQMSDGIKKLYEAAKKDGEVTWSTSQSNTEYAEDVAKHFMGLYPGVRVNVVRTTGQVQYQRLTQEIKSSTVSSDVYSTYEETHLVALKNDKQILSFTPENAAGLTDTLKEIAEDGFWYPTAVSPVAIGINTNLVKPADEPKTWMDLTDPKWKGQVAIGHPGFSGSAGVWVMALEKLYGWQYFEKLAKNEPQIGRSIVDSVNLILSGERKVAMVPISNVLEHEAKGNPVKVIYPSDGTLVLGGSTFIPAKAPHPNAAKLLVEYFMSKDYSEYAAKEGRIPLRADSPKPSLGQPLSAYKNFILPTEHAIANVNRIKEKFRDTFGI